MTASHNEQFTAAGLDPAAVTSLIQAALAEDLAGGTDVTTAATVPTDQTAVGHVVSRASGILAGSVVAQAVFAEVAHTAGHRLDAQASIGDGAHIAPGDVVVTVEGHTADLLTAERTALNLIGHLSGIATHTHRWVDAVLGTDAAIRDTRKTTPLLRALEKYAVRCGGGVNHRMSLADAALVKDNHVVAAGGVPEAFRLVRERFADLDVEVEVDTVADAVAAVEAGADLVLLDNFSTEDLREAVRLVAGRARLEASGGLTLDRAREVASTGVDYLAVGALTHSSPVLDIGLDLVAQR